MISSRRSSKSLDLLFLDGAGWAGAFGYFFVNFLI
jgi:hypothetical protein